MAQALIIDDNNFNNSILTQFLSDEGMTSVVVSNPNNLNEKLTQLEDVQVVFLDLEMPHLDGFEVLSKLRVKPEFQSVPIIAHSVHISEIKVTHDAGFDGFIGKPLNADKFTGQLSRILSGKAVWETA